MTLNKQISIPARHLRFAAWVFGAALIGLAIYFVARIPAVAYQIKISTTDVPEKLTELYFDNPSTIPASVVPGKPVTVSYHIHNLEYRPTKYQVTVSMVTNGTTSVIQQKSFILPNGADVDVPVTFTPQRARNNYELVVDLNTQHESILFRSHS